MQLNNEIPKVFISYSWDNEIHKEWVLELADKLTKNGVYVFFDRYDLHAGKDMIHFMETSVRESDKVLITLTPNYKLKAEKRQGGVGAEYSMITAEMFNNQQSDKFIPIVRCGERDICTPVFLKSKIDIDMRDDNDFDVTFEELLRVIYNEYKIKRPILGDIQNFNTDRKTKNIPNQNTSVINIHSRKTKYELDNLWAYDNYSGGPIPEIERVKYSLSHDTLVAQTTHDYLKVIEYKLELAKICQSQQKEADAYGLEEGIRKTYVILSNADKPKAKELIFQYNQDMARYIDQDVGTDQ